MYIIVFLILLFGLFLILLFGLLFAIFMAVYCQVMDSKDDEENFESDLSIGKEVLFYDKKYIIDEYIYNDSKSHTMILHKNKYDKYDEIVLKNNKGETRLVSCENFKKIHKLNKK